MSKQTVIVSGGMVEKDFALSILKSEETEFVIGVDRGLVFLYDNEIKPDYIVGDFDSVPRKPVEYYREELDVPVREFNPVKDASDTEIALRLCLGLNRKKIVILGAAGCALVAPDRSPVGKCAMFTNCAGSRSGRLHYGRSQ